MGCINYNDAAFRALFPAYSNATTYPQATLQGYWNSATCYLSNMGWSAMSLAQQTLALNQMTAHLVYLAGIIATGQVPGLVDAATIDKISVTLEPPPVKTQFRWWLSLTPYGQQLIALLQVVGVGGYYAGTGVPGRAGFRLGGLCY